jgi:spoIIIJ-associated protein
MEYIEVSAKTVSEAITKASIELSTPSDGLDIQIISEGSRGFLGIGSKPARIKVAIKAEKNDAQAPVKKEESKAVEKEIKKEFKETKEETKKAVSNETKEADKQINGEIKKDYHKKKNNKKPYSNDRREKKESAVVSENKKSERKYEIVDKTEEEIAAMKASADKFLKDVFGAMGIDVVLNMEYVKEGGCLEIDFSGAEMGVLIGKRGQTLDSLQYLTSLVVNKGQKGYVRVKLDTEDYRRRRKETLENLAKNIANRVRKTRKSVVLEPMNPYERRIIHSALQPNKYVETYSEGNEPYRHIVVTLKKQSSEK